MEFIRIYDGIAYGNLLQFAIEHGHRNSGFTHEFFVCLPEGTSCGHPVIKHGWETPEQSLEVSFAISKKNMMLVGGFNPSEKYEFVSWDYYSQYMESHKIHVAVCQNLVPLVNIKIAGKWMFIPLKMVLIGIYS